MTVADLIAHLQTLPQDLPVAYSKFSEYALLEKRDIEVANLCLPREDGWVPLKRDDKPFQAYLLLPR